MKNEIYSILLILLLSVSVSAASNIALNRTYTYDPAPQYYLDVGNLKQTNGIYPAYGSNACWDNGNGVMEWGSFSFYLNLGGNHTITNISEFTCRGDPDGTAGVYIPAKVEFYLSNDNSTWVNVGNDSSEKVGQFSVIVSNLNYSYAKTITTNGGGQIIMGEIEVFGDDISTTSTTTTSTTTTTTTTLKPIINTVIANKTNTYSGSSILISAKIYNKTNALNKWWFKYNGTLGNISSAVNGSVSLIWSNTNVLSGNYTIIGYVNDTFGNENSSIGYFVNFYTTTTTTTTTLSPLRLNITYPINNTTVYNTNVLLNATSNYNVSNCNYTLSGNISNIELFGDGHDGVVTVSSSNKIINNYTRLSSNQASTNTTITVDSTTEFKVGDLIMIYQTQASGTGTTAGRYIMRNIIAKPSSTRLTINKQLDYDFFVNNGGIKQNSSQVINIPQYRSLRLTSGASIIPTAWLNTTRTGGVVIFKVQDKLQNNGTISATGKGFISGVVSNNGYSVSGTSYNGLGIKHINVNTANAGGGGSTKDTTKKECGGGGGYLASGSNGYDVSSTAGYGLGGSSYGQSNLSTIFLGSSGGSAVFVLMSSPQLARGGNGSGAIYIFANNVTNNGGIVADTSTTTRENSAGRGGFGSGGSIYIVGNYVNIGTDGIKARGNASIVGTTSCVSGTSGFGSVGRIKIDYMTLVGTNTQAFTKSNFTSYYGPSNLIFGRNRNISTKATNKTENTYIQNYVSFGQGYSNVSIQCKTPVVAGAISSKIRFLMDFVNTTTTSTTTTSTTTTSTTTTTLAVPLNKPSIVLISPVNASVQQLNNNTVFRAQVSSTNQTIQNSTLKIWNGTSNGLLYTNRTNTTNSSIHMVNISYKLTKYGTYLWNVYATDNSSISSMASKNKTVFVTTTTSTTATTTSTTTTSTTIPAVPLTARFYSPPPSNTYATVNSVSLIKTRVTCYLASCTSINTTAFTNGLTVDYPIMQTCNSLAYGKSCNLTFDINASGTVNSTYKIWTITEFKEAYGLNATAINMTILQSSASTNSSIIIGRGDSGDKYVFSNNSVYLKFNISCIQGFCGRVNVSLEKNGNRVLNNSNSTIFIIGNPIKYCGNLLNGMSCNVTFRLNYTGSGSNFFRFYGIVNSTYEEVLNQSGVVNVYALQIPQVTQNISKNSTISCNITTSDPDGDSVSLTNSTIYWYSNTTIMSVGTTYLNCSNISTECDFKNTIFCSACPVDQHGYIGLCNISNGAYVVLRPPLVYPYIIPSSPMDGDNLVCYSNSTSPDGALMNYTYKWFVNNVSTAFNTQTLGSSATSQGQNWTCQVIAYDTMNIVKANSSSVYISAACPSIPSLISLVNNSRISSIPVDFDWSDSIISGGYGINYSLQVADSNSFAYNLVDISLIQSEYSSNDSYSDGQFYYWRARAYSNGCYSGWSDVFRFKFVNGSCDDGIRNYHNGSWETGIDCGGPCVVCDCALANRTHIIQGISNSTGLSGTFNITYPSQDDLERHCYDGCYAPEFGETDFDCGGQGIWACGACSVNMNCTRNTDCADGLFCDGVKCSSNNELDYCFNGKFDSKLNESDIDCGGPCNNCDIGKRCLSSMDCQDDLVCNQYDVCMTPTTEIQRKKGVQDGGDGTRGLSMNKAYCAGVNDLSEKIPVNSMSGSAAACVIFNNNVVDYSDPLNFNPALIAPIYSYYVDTMEFKNIWEGLHSGAISNPSEILHLEAYVPTKDAWIPIWFGSDGQEFPCTSDSQCEQIIYWDQNSLTQSKCEYSSLFNAKPKFSLSEVSCSYLCDISRIASFVADCPPECQHCTPMPNSHLYNGKNEIDKTGCLMMPLCGGTKYRLSAKLYETDMFGKIYASQQASNYVCEGRFTTKFNDKVSIAPGCEKLDKFNKMFSGSTVDNSCIRPLFWDVGNCDGIPLTVSQSDKSAVCNAREEINKNQYVNIGCKLAVSTKPLLEYGGCTDNSEPVDVMIDFKNYYDNVLSKDINQNGLNNELFRGTANQLTNKKIEVAIVKERVINGQTKEFLIYDNLGSKLYENFITGSTDYFDIYRGQEKTDDKDPQYGSRLRIPLCKNDKYRIILSYYDVAARVDRGSQSSQGNGIVSGGITTAFSIGNLYMETARKLAPLESSQNVKDAWVLYKMQDLIPNIISGGEQIVQCNTQVVNPGVPSGYIEKLLSDSGGKILGVRNFVPSESSILGEDGKPMCYASFRYSYDYLSKEYGDVDVVAALRGKLNDSDYSTLKQPDEWTKNFMIFADPMDFSLPKGITKDGIVNILLFEGVLAAIGVLLKILLYYATKILLWMILYALVMRLWTRAGSGVSLVYLAIIILLILIFIGKIASYQAFIKIFKGG